MRHLVTRLLLGLFLIGKPAVAAAPAPPPPAVVPLTAYGHGIICTAWSINEKKGYWATAGHCIEPDQVYFILDQPVTVVEDDDQDDIAILKTTIGGPALDIASTQPEVGDDVWVPGFPLANHKIIVAFGRIMALDADIPVSQGFFEPPKIYTVLLTDATILPGHSGSPIFHGRKVVSLAQIGGQGIGGGLQWRLLVQHLRPYLK